MPRKKNPANAGLPTRWRKKGRCHYYIPRKHELIAFDDKTEFPLGPDLAKAHEEFGRRMSGLSSPSYTNRMDHLCDSYLKHEWPQKKLQSREDIPKYVGLIRSIMENSRPADVDYPYCVQLYTELQSSKGLNTCNKIMETLSDIFSYAMRTGSARIIEHPMIGKFKKKKPEPKKIVYTVDEIQAALTVANDILRAYVDLKLITGLRRTDMLGLKPHDYAIGKGLVMEASKTNKAQFFTETPDLKRAVENAIIARPTASEFLFCTRNGDCYLDERKKAAGFESMWQRWIDKAIKQKLITRRIQERKLRNLASDLAESDEDASALLNHADPEFTKRVYRSSKTKPLPSSVLVSQNED